MDIKAPEKPQEQPDVEKKAARVQIKPITEQPAAPPAAPAATDEAKPADAAPVKDAAADTSSKKLDAIAADAKEKLDAKAPPDKAELDAHEKEAEKQEHIEELIAAKTYYLPIHTTRNTVHVLGIIPYIVLGAIFLAVSGAGAYFVTQSANSGGSDSGGVAVLDSGVDSGAGTDTDSVDTPTPTGSSSTAAEQTLILTVTKKSSGFLFWKKSWAEVSWDDSNAASYDFLHLLVDAENLPDFFSDSTTSIPLASKENPFVFEPRDHEKGGANFQLCAINNDGENCASISASVEVSL